MSKISRTFSIDDKIYQKFEDICKSKQINKSEIIQDSIKHFIGENYDVNFTIDYKLKFIDSEIVKITKKENEFVFLSNGNKVNIFDFELLYEEFDKDVKNVLINLQSEKSIDSCDIVYPEILNDSFCDPEKAKTIFDHIDVININFKENENIKTIVDHVDVINTDLRTFDEKKKDLINRWRKEETDRRQNLVSFDLDSKNIIINNVKDKIKKLSTEEYKETCSNIIGKTFNSSTVIESHIKNTIQYIINTIILEHKNNIFAQNDYIDIKVSYNSSSLLIEIPNDFLIASNEISILISENYKIEKEKIIITSQKFSDSEYIFSKEEKKDISIRKSHRREQIINFKTLETNNIKETLEYIFNTNVELEIFDLYSERTKNIRKLLKLKIDKKYHKLTELNSLLSFIDYDLIHMKETLLVDKIKERIDKINDDNFVNDAKMILNKQKHIEETLSNLLLGLIREDEKVKVSFDSPLYLIMLPTIIIYNFENLLYFISKCYDIPIDKFLIKSIENIKINN